MPLLSQLFPPHHTLPSDRFHSVAPSFPLQHFNILTSVPTRSPGLWPPLRTHSYFLSNPRTSLSGQTLPGPLFQKADLIATRTLQSHWLGSVFCAFNFLHLFLFISFSSALWLRTRGKAWRAGISILGEKKQHKKKKPTQIDRPESSEWLYGFSAQRWARGSCSHARPATRRLNTK